MLLCLKTFLLRNISQRFHEKRNQQWINLKGGFAPAVRGQKAIHGRVKIKGQEYRGRFLTPAEASMRPGRRNITNGFLTCYRDH